MRDPDLQEIVSRCGFIEFSRDLKERVSNSGSFFRGERQMLDSMDVALYVKILLFVVIKCYTCTKTHISVI